MKELASYYPNLIILTVTPTKMFLNNVSAGQMVHGTSYRSPF